MDINLITLLIYTVITLSGIYYFRFLSKNNWRITLASSFCLLFFIYTGIGLSEASVNGIVFLPHYIIYLYTYLTSFYIFSLKLTQETKTQKIHQFLEKKKSHDLIIAIYLISALIPLVAPDFKLHYLLSPPSLNFLEIFSAPTIQDDATIKKINKYLNLLLIAPFLISLGAQNKRPFKVFTILAALNYIEYVSSAYLSRSSILINLTIFSTYIIYQYPDKRRSIFTILLIGTPLAGFAAAWFLAFRLGAVYDNAITDLIWFMFNIELNFPRDAGIPLYTSEKHGDIAEYLIWIFTIPIPKAFFGQFINLNINYDIAFALTGYRPDDMGFSVPLTGNLLAAIYSLDHFFWLEPIIAGALTGIALKTALQYKNNTLLISYIMIINSYVYNRAGISGFSPPIYNTFIWIILIWQPLANIMLSNKSRPINKHAHQATVAH